VDLAGTQALALDRLMRDRIVPGEILLAGATLAVSLALAFRRVRLRAPDPPPDARALPEPLREIRLFRLDYGLVFERGRLRPGARSARRLSIETAARRRIPWRAPTPDFPGEPGRLLEVIDAGGRAIASVDPATRRVAFHEADLARVHGLGRRGRSVVLWPLFLATIAFAWLASSTLGEFLSRNAAMPRRDVQLSLAIAVATFVGVTLLVITPVLWLVSAILRRVRRAQLRRRYEPALRAFLESALEAQ
jgi:hypothetical protein